MQKTRKTSVSRSVKIPGWESLKTLVSVTAYQSFSGEVEASNTPTIRRLTPSRRHQLSCIAHSKLASRPAEHSTRGSQLVNAPIHGCSGNWVICGLNSAPGPS